MGALSVEIQAEREKFGWAGNQMNIPDAHKYYRGKGIKIAILDTGIDPDHPDLKENILEGKSFVGGSVEDRQGHGTHCAGIAAASKNGRGFVGVAPEASLLIAKVLGDNGSGSIAGIVDGIDWAVDRGADIINMSLGASDSSPDLFRAIHRALVQKKIVICAAGNEGRYGGNTVGYPGRYGSVISVGSYNKAGTTSVFSSKGGEIDLLAPGEGIWSTYKRGGYAVLSGTSMATPFVSGLAALILAKHRAEGGKTPIEDCEDMRNHLLRMTAHPAYFDSTTGYGPLLPFRKFE